MVANNQSERNLFRVHPSSSADLCHINSVQLVKCLDKPPEAIVKELEFASSEIELVVVSVKPCVYDMFLRSAPAGAPVPAVERFGPQKWETLFLLITVINRAGLG